MNYQYLCNFDLQDPQCENDTLNKLWSQQWIPKNGNILKDILKTEFATEPLTELLKNLLENESDKNEVLHLGIGSILTFCDQNWVTKEKVDLGLEWPEAVNTSLLHADSVEIFTNIQNPELLLLSLQIFKILSSLEKNVLYLWWYFRCKVIQQRVLEDNSASLFAELVIILAKLANEAHSLSETPRVQILLYMEMSQAYLIYGRVQKADEYLCKAKEVAGFKLELTGILGKRTRYQQNALPQLALSSELDESVDRPSAEESHGCSDLPGLVELQDDVRLNNIQYNEQVAKVELPSLEQTICLLTVQYLRKAQANDELIQEELQPYVELILSQKNGPWCTRVCALLLRCKLESNHKRTVERAMVQCEAIVNQKIESSGNKLSYLWASGLQPEWTWRQQLADLYLSLGMVRTALDHFYQLQLWEDVIVCYTIMELRHKAAEIIQQEIDKKPTVKLYCLLGDATDKLEWFEKAWEFSEHKSSRAQRHWGNNLFNHKEYLECIPHYEQSLAINSLQEHVWLRLGFAALICENWETSARAYRRYTYLQPNSFEAWNNLAKVYVKQGDKDRAYRALMEALKFNYDNWKLWENVIAVSMDTGHFDDVIRGCHRLLDLRNKLEDLEVLTLLVRAVCRDLKDAEGNSSARLQKRVLELLGRITAIHQNQPEVWQLYSEISPTNLLRGQRLIRAYRGFTQNGNWPNSPETCEKVLKLAVSLLQYSEQARKEAEDKDRAMAEQQLSSARLTGQSVLRAAAKQNWPECQSHINELQVSFDNVTEYMKSLL